MSSLNVLMDKLCEIISSIEAPDGATYMQKARAVIGASTLANSDCVCCSPQDCGNDILMGVYLKQKGQRERQLLTVFWDGEDSKGFACPESAWEGDEQVQLRAMKEIMKIADGRRPSAMN